MDIRASKNCVESQNFCLFGFFFFLGRRNSLFNGSKQDWTKENESTVRLISCQGKDQTKLLLLVIVKALPTWGATIAQWICLHLPSAALGSSSKHTIEAFIIYSNFTIFVV